MKKKATPKKKPETMRQVMSDFGLSSPYADPAYEGLSYRAVTILNSANLFTREQILESVKTGDMMKRRNVGPAVLREILEWLGVPKRGSLHNVKVCPTCAGKGTIKE